MNWVGRNQILQMILVYKKKGQLDGQKLDNINDACLLKIWDELDGMI